MQLYKKKWIVFLFLLITNASVAQNKIKYIALSLNPFTFIDTDAGIAIGAEYGTGKKTSVFTEFGLLLYDAYRNKENKNALTGFKIKPSFRYYFDKQKKHGITTGSYIAGEFLLKSVNYYRYDPLRINDAVGNFAYTYIGGYTIKKNIIGFSAIWGSKFFMDKNEKLLLDLYTGVGFRNRTLNTKGIPANASVNANSFFERKQLNTLGETTNQAILGSFYLGIRVVYRIK